ncbi:beta-N-acetylglucosaminidase [Brachyspira suanatina]|uniref:Beta-N-acetylglucosaminidase n=1 Tax=Brachyspira suanatina TaxID=381802 RepID=A0A0G4K5D0_9SPIR|nr:glycoside hydrolase family 3 N-terminal domain-containing protein [Brachyspira suanatina]CRF32375.1 beta-N-acetylglucosaminidase [Brachyspira suanatina]
MSYIIIITIILFFLLVFLFITHFNNNEEKTYINNIDNAKEILSFISVKNYDNELINIINNTKISGIIINIDNLDIDTLSNIIKTIKRSINRKIFITLDQDYKSTYNIAYHQKFKVYPSYIGERESEEYAYKIAYQRALKLKSLGINMILSPICNTYCNEKSHLKENIFTNDKILASRLIYQTVKAQKDAGIITALKYFPKYYDDELYIDEKIDNVESVLDNRETFLAGIKANADIIVMSHIKNTDKCRDFLINNMKFKGIIMTDYINDNKNIIGYGINVFSYNYYRNKNIKNMIKNNLKETDLEVCSKVLNLMKKL